MRIVVFFTFVVGGRIGLGRIDIRSLATANSSVPLPLFLAGSVEIVSSFERSEILVSGGIGKEDERKGVCESSGKGVCREFLGVNCLVFVSWDQRINLRLCVLFVLLLLHFYDYSTETQNLYAYSDVS